MPPEAFSKVPAKAGGTGLDRAEQAFLLGHAGEVGDEEYSRLVRKLSGAETAASAAGQAYRYDAALLTLAAGIESRRYDRGGAGEWQRMNLPWPAGVNASANYYTRDVPAHVHWGNPGQKRLFILLGSSYSTWQRGTWTNKTIHFLRSAYGDPHMAAFAGFLTPEFLALNAQRPALTGGEPARDLHARLRAAIQGWKQAGRIAPDTQIGLIGYSGGGSLVISLLAEDERQGRANGAGRLFGAGGIAFSPVLDLPTSFEILDRANAILTSRGFPPGRALTRPVFPDFVHAFLQGYTASNPRPYLQLTASDASPAAVLRRKEIIGRFYREFQAVDLDTTSRAHYPGAPDAECSARVIRQERRLNYRTFYEEAVFEHYRRHFQLGAHARLATYACGDTDLLAVKHAPLYIVFAADDPVLARVDDGLAADAVGGALGSLSPPLAAMMRAARRQPNVRIYVPERGAHMGYFLDGSFLEAVLRAFFAG